MNTIVKGNSVCDKLVGMFPNRTLTKLNKLISNKENVSLYVVTLRDLKSVEGEALYINSIERYFTKGSYVREDKEYEILYGDLIPGTKDIIESINKGKLVSNKISTTNPLVPKNKKFLIYKSSDIYVNNKKQVPEINIFAIIKGE